MAQLLIRHIDEDVIKHLKQRAKQHHRSLQAELKIIVESAVIMTLVEARKKSRLWHKRLSKLQFSDSTSLLQEDRNR